MEEDKKIEAAPVTAAAPTTEAPKAQTAPVAPKSAPNSFGYHGNNGPRTRNGNEPHGSSSSGRPGDRKFGDHRGRPGERRGGRGGFRGGEKEYEERVVDINRVSKTVQGGKHIRFSALVVIGDQKGKYGFAIAKSGEVPDAIKKSLEKAKKTIYNVKIVKGDTIAHEVEGVYAATKVVLKPARPGTGIIAGGAVRAVIELAGIKNVVSKVYGSRSSINVIRATHAGLQSLKDYGKVMVLRGLKTPEEIKAMQPKPATKPVKVNGAAPAAHVATAPKGDK